MGGTTNGTDDDGTGRPGDDGRVISGEIVPTDQCVYDETGRNQYGRSRNGQQRWNARNSNGRGRSAFADEDTVAGVIADRVRGMTLRAIAAKWGISHSTASNWTEGDVKRRLQADVDVLRAEAAQHLATVQREAWGMYEVGKANSMPRVMAEALNRVESATISKAKLEGAIRPVKVDVSVTEVTAAEQELQEMINEAKVKAAAEEQVVVDAASQDPDL